MSFDPFAPLHSDVGFSSLRHGRGTLRHRLPGQLDVLKDGLIPEGSVSERDVELFGLDKALDMMKTRKMMRMDSVVASRHLDSARNPGRAFVPTLLRPGNEHAKISPLFRTASGLDNGELLAIVGDTNKPDSIRLKALQSLIDNNAVDELHTVVNDTGRCDSWRHKALRALIREEHVDILHSIVNNTARCDSWRSEALDALCAMASRSSGAAECLYQLVNNTGRCDSWRHRALQALINAGCSEYLQRIASNTDRCNSWRAECRRALDAM